MFMSVRIMKKLKTVFVLFFKNLRAAFKCYDVNADTNSTVIRLWGDICLSGICQWGVDGVENVL